MSAARPLSVSAYAPLSRLARRIPDGHGLHRMREDANRGVVDPGRGAKQNYSILWAQLRRRLCHGLLSPPALSEGGHRGLAAASWG